MIVACERLRTLGPSVEVGCAGARLFDHCEPNALVLCQRLILGLAVWTLARFVMVQGNNRASAQTANDLRCAAQDGRKSCNERAKRCVITSPSDEIEIRSHVALIALERHLALSLHLVRYVQRTDDNFRWSSDRTGSQPCRRSTERVTNTANRPTELAWLAAKSDLRQSWLAE